MKSILVPKPSILMLTTDHLMIDRRIVQQARSLSHAGYSVQLIAGFECPDEQHYIEDGINIHRYAYDWDDERLKRLLGIFPQNRWVVKVVRWMFAALASKVLSFTPFETFVMSKCKQFSAEIVHVHDLPLLRLAVALATKRGAKVVHDAHEIYFEQECLSHLACARLRHMEKRYISNVDLFITVNDFIADHFFSLYNKRPLVLLNAADRPPKGFDEGARTRFREKAGLPQDARVVLYQGWFSRERNLASLVRAAESLPEDSYVVMIGYGEHEEELRTALKGTAGENRVRFLGRIESDQILAFTSGADVGVIPYQPIDLNHTLCSPNKFFEYIQAGVPFIAHDLAFFRDMEEKYNVVSVGDISTPVGMARAINRILHDQDRLTEMRRACIEAAKILNWETESAKLLEAYKGLN